MAHRGCRHTPTALAYDNASDELSRFFAHTPGWYPDWDAFWINGVCEYGNCRELLCPECSCTHGGWGPVGCPCADHIPDMRMRPKPPRPGLKPSIARRRSGRHRARP